MDKVKNFRQLGGIPTADGRKIKDGLFYRSAFLDEATDEDIAYLKSLSLKKIFDYRDVSEVDKNNDIKYKKIGARHSHCPNNIKAGRVYKLQNGGVDRAFIRIRPADVCEFYSLLPFNNIGYKSMVESLIHGEVPFLQHCTAGKDRAGLGCALLLGILGVSYDDIVKDYMASIEIRDYIRDKMMERIPAPVKILIRKNYEPLFIVDKSYIDAALSAINERYGDFDTYLLKEYNLTPEIISELRNKYTV